LLAAAYVLDKGTDGIVSLTLSSPLLSTPAWVDDANLLWQQLPPEVQEVLSEHEAAGTVDAEACQEASKVFYERFVYAGDKPSNLPECAGAPRNEVVYRPMWGPTEFRATGTLLGFDLTPRLGEIDVPVLFIAGGFDEARPETVASFQQRIRGARLEVIEGVAHASLSKAPNRYAVLLEAFLASTGAGR
jgi:proline iminopeptidase